ncbi:M23 family peptidase [Haliangium sp. UPWRP_2]|nr:M23 family peptidase [Haliangium sp. UPWRP_2]
MTRRTDPERGDFSARRGALLVKADKLVWPVSPTAITRVGDTVMVDRNGTGEPHEGVDLFVPAGTPVVSATRGRVTTVLDGRFSSDSHRKRAGLFVEVTAANHRLFRYLHLGTAAVSEGTALEAGDLIGTVAPPYTSGTGRKSHLHFEIREARSGGQRYGRPINPLLLLPRRNA